MDMVKPLTENSAMTRLQDILRLGRQLSPQINSIILERHDLRQTRISSKSS